MADTDGVLIRFEFENFRSFRDRAELSMLSTQLSDADAPREVRVNHRGGTEAVLPSACIFGANASGKSGVLHALDHMRTVVMRSFSQRTDSSSLPYSPFGFRSGGGGPSRFLIEIAADGVRYEYGFEHDAQTVSKEWAWAFPQGRRAFLFERSGDEMTFGSTIGKGARAIEQIMRPNSLVLSSAAAAGHEGLRPLYQWFHRNLQLVDLRSRPFDQVETLLLLGDGNARDRVLRLIQSADMGVTDARINPTDPELVERMERFIESERGTDLTEGQRHELARFTESLRLSHDIYGVDVEFDRHDESAGTLAWIGMIGPVAKALDEGTVLMIDEVDSSLHPRLAAQLLRLFQDPVTNPRNAQLITNAIGVALLRGSPEAEVLGQDQIWFTEKLDGASTLYSLADFAPQKADDIVGRYLAGRYGGVPQIDQDLFVQALQSQHE